MIDLFVAAIFMVQAAPQAISQKPPVPITISREEANQHMVEPDALYLRVNLHSSDPIDGWVTVEAVADTTGAVVSARAVPESAPELSPEMLAQAESLVRALHFRPFERNGHAVAARVERYVSLLPPEQKPARRVPFPRVKDWNKVKITLLRGSPYGTEYTVAVHGDGTVLYKGYSGVAFTGRHRGYVPPRNVEELVKLFEQADYFSLRNEYAEHAEAFERIISIEIDGRRKQVEDQNGLSVGMPLAVERLEDAIDRLSGSARWTQGNAETLAALLAEHWDFKSTEAAATLARVASSGNAAAVRGLVGAGVPLNGKSGRGMQPDPDTFYTPLEAAGERGDLAVLQTLLGGGAAANVEDLGRALVAAGARGDLAMLKALLDAGAAAGTEDLDRALAAAAGSGNVEALHLLLANGASMNARDHQGRTMLMAAAASGSPAMVKEILKFHPDVNATSLIPQRPCVIPADRPPEPAGDCKQLPESDGHTALMEAAWGDHERLPPEGVDRAEVVRLLLAAGADVNAHDMIGNPPLMLSTDNPAIVLLLLQAGADANARNYKGETALVRTSNDQVKRMLIEHGALEPAKGK